MTHESPPKREIVLLGAGHTNAHILRMWRTHPIADARLTCVSNFPVATYSGMLPGVLSGQYPLERMQIDLGALCAAVGARLVVAEVTGLDLDARRLTITGRPALPFHALSIGIGSVPNAAVVDRNDPSVIMIKPMQTFIDRLERRLHALASTGRGSLRIAVVGAGVGGLEILFCLPARLRRLLPATRFELTLVDAGEGPGGGLRPRTRRRVAKLLKRRCVTVRSGHRVTRVSEGRMELDTGESIETELILWATGATAPALLSQLNLPIDSRGFLATRPTLQTTADAPIFAVGDCGTIEGTPVPKAGVYAVRQGPILWENLGRMLDARPLVDYVPQTGFLKLLNTGDGKAIAEYKSLTLRGRWCWWLKDRIDGRFMDMYQHVGDPRRIALP